MFGESDLLSSDADAPRRMAEPGNDHCYSCGCSGHWAKDCSARQKPPEASQMISESTPCYLVFKHNLRAELEGAHMPRSRGAAE